MKKQKPHPQKSKNEPERGIVALIRRNLTEARVIEEDLRRRYESARERTNKLSRKLKRLERGDVLLETDD